MGAIRVIEGVGWAAVLLGTAGVAAAALKALGRDLFGSQPAVDCAMRRLEAEGKVSKDLGGGRLVPLVGGRRGPRVHSTKWNEGDSQLMETTFTVRTSPEGSRVARIRHRSERAVREFGCKQ